MNQLIWYRSDLRVHDHEALTQAVEKAKHYKSNVIALFVWCDDYYEKCGTGPAKLTSIRLALKELADALGQLGIPFSIVRISKWAELTDKFANLVIANTITDIHYHYEPGYYEISRDQTITQTSPSLAWHCYHDLFLVPPDTHLNKQAGPYKVFTAYKKSVLSQQQSWLRAPFPCPAPVKAAVKNLLPALPETLWSNPLNLPVTEQQAHRQLDAFLGQVNAYKDKRDYPSENGTSRLSVALANGTITSRQIAWTIHSGDIALSSSVYFSEILWREFFKYIVVHNIGVCKGLPFSAKNDQFPWRNKANHLTAWQQGKTGVPIVDAAMTQLNQTGWMHNRLRMVCAMYLSKILQLNWRDGERHFAEQLADFDFCANNGGWQWSSSTGVDAAPYFRIFNPYSQSQKFDPDGSFIQTYLSEMKGVSKKQMHQPSKELCQQINYPLPIVSYEQARKDTLEKFKAL